MKSIFLLISCSLLDLVFCQERVHIISVHSKERGVCVCSRCKIVIEPVFKFVQTWKRCCITVLLFEVGLLYKTMQGTEGARNFGFKGCNEKHSSFHFRWNILVSFHVANSSSPVRVSKFLKVRKVDWVCADSRINIEIFILQVAPFIFIDLLPKNFFLKCRIWIFFLN